MDLIKSSLLLVWSLLTLSAGDAKITRVNLATVTTPGGNVGQPVTSFYAPISIGTPAQVFNIQFDVALSKLFVPALDTTLTNHNKYNCESSSSCVDTNNSYVLQYQGCQFKGKLFKDFVSINQVSQDNSLEMESHQFEHEFLAVSDVTKERMKQLPIDGLFGLSPIEPSTMDIIKLRYNPQISLWISPKPEYADGGQLLLGGTDERLYEGPVSWHRIRSDASQLWTVEMEHVSVDGVKVSREGDKNGTLISSGLNESYGPTASVESIYKLLGSEPQRNSSLQLIDCQRVSSLPPICFYIDDSEYQLKASSYVKHLNDTTCYLAIFPALHHSQWILGTDFLSGYYSIYDIKNQLVGFAKSRA